MGASEVTTGNHLAAPGAPRDRQDKRSGVTTAPSEEPGARASSGKSRQQQGPTGTRASSSRDVQGSPGARVSSSESGQQRWPPGMKASNSRDSTMHVVCFDTTSRTLTTMAREALVTPTRKNCKWEQLPEAEETRVEEKTRYIDGKLMNPRMESNGLGDSQWKEGLLDRRLVMIRSDKSIRQLGGGETSSATSRMKDGPAIVSQKIDRVTAPHQSDDEHGKVRAMGCRCKSRASGGSEAGVRRRPQPQASRGLPEVPHQP